MIWKENSVNLIKCGKIMSKDTSAEYGAGGMPRNTSSETGMTSCTICSKKSYSTIFWCERCLNSNDSKDTDLL